MRPPLVHRAACAEFAADEFVRADHQQEPGDRLEQSGLIDTREDKSSLIHCLRALDGSADAKRRKG